MDLVFIYIWWKCDVENWVQCRNGLFQRGKTRRLECSKKFHPEFLNGPSKFFKMHYHILQEGVDPNSRYLKMGFSQKKLQSYNQIIMIKRRVCALWNSNRSISKPYLKRVPTATKCNVGKDLKFFFFFFFFFVRPCGSLGTILVAWIHCHSKMLNSEKRSCIFFKKMSKLSFLWLKVLLFESTFPKRYSEQNQR